MAKYEDYVKKDEIDAEIDESAAESKDRRESGGESGFELPDRFKGKTPAEIAQSYVELEQAYSKQGNDLGRMRSTMDEYIKDLQSSQTINASEEATADETSVTIDDVYEDPEGALQRAAEKAVGSRIASLEQQLAEAQVETRVEALNEKFPGWDGMVRSQEFLDWVQENPYRLRVAQAANGFDMDAAEEILGLYNEHKGLHDVRAEAERDRALSDASLESSSAEVLPSEARYSRSEIIEHKMRAQHGHQDSVKWLKANAEGIAIAYEEGNFTD